MQQTQSPKAGERTLREYLSQFQNVDRIQLDDPTFLDVPIKSAWFSIAPRGVLFVVCGGTVIASFEPMDSNVSSRTYHLIVDDTDYNAWRVKQSEGRTTEPAPGKILKLVMSI